MIEPPSRKNAARGETEEPAVLFLPRHMTSYRRMLDLAVAIRAKGRLRPVMLLASEELSSRTEECRAAGLSVCDVTEAIERKQRERAPRLHRLMKRFGPWCERHDRLGNALLPSLLRMRHLRNRLQVEYAVFRALCEALRPAAIIVPGDRELPPVPAMLRTGLDLDIPTIIEFAGVPYGGGLELSRADYSRFQLGISRLPPLLNLVAARRFPSQVLTAKSGPMLFSPGWLTLALAAENMLSANPWVQGGGNSRYVFQQDQKRLERFVEWGLSPEKAVLVGDSALDPMYRTWAEKSDARLRLNGTYGLRSSRCLTVMSVPNDAEHNVCDWPTHLERMDRYFAKLSDSGSEVLLSLHPKSERSTYQPLADRHELRIADESLADLLPAADLFVCSGSSTIFWAKLCAIPTINLDYLDVMDSDFGGPGVVDVRTAEEFGRSLAIFHSEGPEGLVRDLESTSERLREDHLFDGHTIDRICSFLWKLQERNDRGTPLTERFVSRPTATLAP